MREEKAGSICGAASPSRTGKQIQIVSRGGKDQKDIADKKDQCTAQILRHNKYDYMQTGNDCREGNARKSVLLPECPRDKEDKKDFDKLGRLKGNASEYGKGDLGAVRCLTEN